jgi:hypothetical protein
MTTPDAYDVVLFDSVSQALLSEKILKQAGIPHKLIPVPRHISSDCGVCIRFSDVFRQQVQAVLTDQVAFKTIQSL